MSKPTTSDYLKLVFKYAAESDADDWKRLSKKKNADGQWVREFENRATGSRLTVTEMEQGYFNVKGKDIEANIRIPESFAQAAQKPAAPASGLYVETDPAKNAAADKALRIIMGDEEGADYDDDDASYGVPDALVKQAGKALANRYCFAVSEEDDMLSAMITPIRYFEEEGCCSDQTGPIYDLLPKCAELMESTWEIFEEGVDTPVKAAQYLQSLGFRWNRDFQDFIDASQTKTLAAALAPDDTAQKLKDYAKKDPGFEKAIQEIVEAEVKYGKDDPAEGKVVKTDAGKGKPKGPQK
ncbi:MAG: hypothetical protein GC185_12185 [Alphaproteobacteria bacterium]|nr:hypothetical protein [Alphaproteobacteria bacterium]